ncbi:MAG: ABC transporter ATP-binding protein [Bacilli bacterium]|nr:ABC transporter ATP-binding protein [Bacilli bacterium]MDD4734284.1 ABC transporter ATP-binding protein [Bacilli bacterium]
MSRKLREEVKIIFNMAWKEIFSKFFSSILIRGLLLTIPIFLSMVINHTTKGSYTLAIIYTLIFIFIVLFYRFSEVLNQRFYYKLYNKIFSYYSNLGINKTKDNSIFSLSRFNLGQYTNTIITDVDIMSTFLASGVIRVVQIFEFFVIYIYFFILDKYLFISAVILSLIMLFVALKSGNRVQQLNEKRKSELDQMTASVHEYFIGIKEIKSFNIFNSISDITGKNINDYLDANAKYNKKNNFNNQLFLSFFELFRLLSIIYAIYLVSIGRIEIGVLLIIYNYYQKIIDNFASILTINVEFRNYKVSLKRFYRLIEYSHSKKKKSEVNLEDFKNNIEFKSILYGYKENPIFKNLSFKIKENQLVSITSRNSKQTSGIFDLLMKLNQPHEGNILINNINIEDIDDKDYYNLISSSREEPAFFNMSIKDNLSIIEDNYEEMVQVCKSIGVHETIMSLDKGYDTIMDNKINLTTIDKQLLSLARVLLKNSKIMLFDESISSFDESTQNKIRKIFNKLKVDHTIIVACHNKKIMEISDKIIIINNKKVSEEGNFEELSDKIFLKKSNEDGN